MKAVVTVLFLLSAVFSSASAGSSADVANFQGKIVKASPFSDEMTVIKFSVMTEDSLIYVCCITDTLGFADKMDAICGNLLLGMKVAIYGSCKDKDPLRNVTSPWSITFVPRTDVIVTFSKNQ